MPQDVNFDEEIKEMEVLVFPLNKSKNEEQLVGVTVASNAVVTVGYDFSSSDAKGIYLTAANVKTAKFRLG